MVGSIIELQPLFSANTVFVTSYTSVTAAILKYLRGGVITVIHNVFTDRRRRPACAVNQENQTPQHFVSQECGLGNFNDFVPLLNSKLLQGHTYSLRKSSNLDKSLS